jgi:hypothetical protein
MCTTRFPLPRRSSLLPLAFWLSAPEKCVRSRPTTGLPMSMMFFHLRDGVDQLIDPDGIALPGPEAVKARALECAFDILAADIREGKLNLNNRIDVEDEGGEVVFSVDFRSLVEISGLEPN